jgi:CO/xanthine dehydrogenase FAD-binding subunit
MKPLTGFDLLRPPTLVGALEMMSTLDAPMPIAGGTDVIPTFKDLGSKPVQLIDLGLIDELRGVDEEDGYVLIGPTTTHAQLLASKLVEEAAPALYDAARWIGSVQIRNRGTVGGNLCNASPAADSAPPLLVHAAEAHIISLEEGHWISLQELFKGPKMTVLEKNEILGGLRFPLVRGAGSSFQRIGRRRGFTLSVVNAAVYIERDGAKIREARIALGSVAPTPIRAPKVEAKLRGREMSEALIEEAAAGCVETAKPIDDIRGTAEYRKDMVGVLVKRAMREAWTRAGGVL